MRSAQPKTVIKAQGQPPGKALPTRSAPQTLAGEDQHKRLNPGSAKTVVRVYPKSVPCARRRSHLQAPLWIASLTLATMVKPGASGGR
jgi:hypothetical protein